MSRRKNGICIFILFLLVLSDARGSGLSTSFVDVSVMDVPLGKPRRVENKRGESLIVWNTGDTPLVIHVQALTPDARELRRPAEPVKDLSWILIEPSTLTLGPHERGQCDVVLSLPADKRLRHKIFQAMIWSRSEPVQGQGVTFSGGLKSRLRFQTVR